MAVFFGFYLDGSTLKVDSDIGYTFKFEEWSVKPYGAVVSYGRLPFLIRSRNYCLDKIKIVPFVTIDLAYKRIAI